MNILNTLKAKLNNNELASQSILVLFIRVFGVLLSFLTLLLLTNKFQEDLVGKFNYLNSILIVLGSVCLLGMNSSFLQFSGRLEALNNFHEIKNIYKKKVKILFASYLILTTCYFLLNLVLIDFFKSIGINSILTKAFAGLFFYAISLLNFEVSTLIIQ